jgi:hypothetical protein
VTVLGDHGGAAHVVGYLRGELVGGLAVGVAVDVHTACGAVGGGDVGGPGPAAVGTLVDGAFAVGVLLGRHSSPSRVQSVRVLRKSRRAAAGMLRHRPMRTERNRLLRMRS